MVYRVYVEKREDLAQEAQQLCADLQTFLKIPSLQKVRVLNRYDAENIDAALFRRAVATVFSEPQLDIVWEDLPKDAEKIFAVEYLPGQYDQRADSAAQCIQILSGGERPTVRTAKVYLLYGSISERDLQTIEKYVINPVDSRLASLAPKETLAMEYPVPDSVKVINRFREMDESALSQLGKTLGLAMDTEDLLCCREYFRKEEQRDPTLTEIRVIDTYWSDHCRHTTFNTQLDKIAFRDSRTKAAYEDYLQARRELGRTKPVTLMDMGTLAAKVLKARGQLTGLDESEEINACTVKIPVTVNGKKEPWLLFFKNETHNHPTEIEPFGGAATCIGGAIRDPLSGRGYVYAAMRLTGAANPLQSIEDTMKGKLPQRKIVTTAAAGYSSYGNQIGLATGIVDELYHPGYAAKRMEIGAVVGAAPAGNVRRETPSAGDAILLLGGRTGRDGCGGATGASKAHTVSSLETCGAEVQKGNALEERKLQRLFRNPTAARMIKRCNDFGAGGVSVAVGELADGLSVDLDCVPKKYEGLDGTELAISESQERMAVVVSEEDAAAFQAMADQENLEATRIAHVTEEPFLRMQWQGKEIVHLSRAFLDTNGAEKHSQALTPKPENWHAEIPETFSAGFRNLVTSLNGCSKQALSQRFDSTIGAGTVLMPFGGKYQKTPIQAMVNKISCEHGNTDDCSVMAWGCNPQILDRDPYAGAYLAVAESVAKLAAAGAWGQPVYLSFQEYFPHLGTDPEKWGKPVAALLGAFEAQIRLHTAAIGGKDSMSGSFESLEVPSTLVSFAVTTASASSIISGELKAPGRKLVWLKPDLKEDGLPSGESLLHVFQTAAEAIRAGKADAAYAPGYGGPAGAVLRMAFGNGIGVRFSDRLRLSDLFDYAYGSLILELTEDADGIGTYLGETISSPHFIYRDERLSLSELLHSYEAKLEPVYPSQVKQAANSEPVPAFLYDHAPVRAAHSRVRPKVLIPVFPGTNCEYDSQKAFAEAGADTEILVIRNLKPQDIADSTEAFIQKLQQSQILFLPGGFSGGDEPDGSAKFITAFLRNHAVSDAVMNLLQKRDGLIGGICNGFQALIKLGLVPYGEIREADSCSPTLTYNTIGRHQSMLVHTRISSNLSPWLSEARPGEVYCIPVSHGEGRFYASAELVTALAGAGQVATQYVDLEGNPTMDIRYNPNGSVFAVEGITSPDGRVFGKMGHAERAGSFLYKNVPGNHTLPMFTSAVRYFQ
jgi:phosphoribosylformylglycinamidine synthase